MIRSSASTASLPAWNADADSGPSESPPNAPGERWIQSTLEIDYNIHIGGSERGREHELVAPTLGGKVVASGNAVDPVRTT